MSSLSDFKQITRFSAMFCAVFFLSSFALKGQECYEIKHSSSGLNEELYTSYLEAKACELLDTLQAVGIRACLGFGLLTENERFCLR